MNRDGIFMQQALEEAGCALREREVPVGAVLVGPEGEVIGRAHNRSIALSDPTAHAEILALREGARTLGNYRLEGTTLYVTVEPCAMCAGALIWARVGRLVYGTRDAKAGAVNSLFCIPGDSRLNHRVEVLEGVREEECRGIIREFFREMREAREAAPARPADCSGAPPLPDAGGA